jgi:hypothetical protein
MHVSQNNLSPASREEDKLIMIEHKVPRRIFGPKKEEVAEWMYND